MREATPARSALARATASASPERSVAVSRSGAGDSDAMAIAMAPLPVPISAAFSGCGARPSARRRDAISKVGKRRLYNELCLWARVKHIWGDKQFKRTEAARAGEVADRSALRSLAYKHGECGGCIASGECGARDLQRLSKRSVALSKWLRFWKS